MIEGHGRVGQKYYQLTHDYLVHSLRDWLTRKQRETRRGRAELRLEDRAALWNEAREPPSAVAMGVSQHPFADRQEEMDLAGTEMMGKAGRVQALDRVWSAWRSWR